MILYIFIFDYYYYFCRPVDSAYYFLEMIMLISLKRYLTQSIMGVVTGKGPMMGQYVFMIANSECFFFFFFFYFFFFKVVLLKTLFA